MIWEEAKRTEYATIYRCEPIRKYYAKVEAFHHGRSALWYGYTEGIDNYEKWGGGSSAEDAKERAAGWIMERILTQ